MAGNLPPLYLKNTFPSIQIIGKENVFFDSETLTEFGHDETEDFVFPPEVALTPNNTEEVSKIMNYCFQNSLPVTPIGAQTGLSGGALSIYGGVGLSLKKMNRIVNLDENNLQITVEPGVITQILQEAAIEMEGYPSGLFYKMNFAEGTTDMAAGIPIAQDVNIMGTSSESIATRKALVINYYGDHDKTMDAHDAAEEYLNDRNLHFDWPVIEEYVTDPSEEANQEKWLTRIIYYLSE